MDFDKAREVYENIPIPEELSMRVDKAIREAQNNKIISRKKERKIMRKVTKIAAAAAAVVLLGTTIGVNASQAFAEDLYDAPIIGAFAKIVTFRSYSIANEDVLINVEIPALQDIEADNEGLPAEVNKEILAKCEAYIAGAQELAKGYHEAFIATGGTEEEWIEHDITAAVDYEVLSQNDDYLSFLVYGWLSYPSFYEERSYYTWDLNAKKIITLEDVLGEDYINIANESIKAQIAAYGSGEDNPFFSEEMGGFTTIDENTKFYMNEKGNPVICFAKYEIAPGYLGEVQFEIEK